MEVRRTVPVKLTVSDDAESLHATITEFQQAANYGVSHARNDTGDVETSKQRLHERTYQDMHEQTDLHATLVQAARSRAADAIKASSPAGKTARTLACRRSPPTFPTTTSALQPSTTTMPHWQPSIDAFTQTTSLRRRQPCGDTAWLYALG